MARAAASVALRDQDIDLDEVRLDVTCSPTPDNCLTPGGLVVTNIIGAVRGPDSRLFRSMLRTYRAAFPTVAVHPVIDTGGSVIHAGADVLQALRRQTCVRGRGGHASL